MAGDCDVDVIASESAGNETVAGSSGCNALSTPIGFVKQIGFGGSNNKFVNRFRKCSWSSVCYFFRFYILFDAIVCIAAAVDSAAHEKRWRFLSLGSGKNGFLAITKNKNC